jgi:hypothetical protein
MRESMRESMRERENVIVKAIMAYLSGLPECTARKRWGSGMGVAGDPDITGCIRGHHFEFEVKRPGKRLITVLQARRLREWSEAGAITGVVTSVAEVRDLLSGL